MIAEVQRQRDGGGGGGRLLIFFLMLPVVPSIPKIEKKILSKKNFLYINPLRRDKEKMSANVVNCISLIFIIFLLYAFTRA